MQKSHQVQACYEWLKKLVKKKINKNSLKTIEQIESPKNKKNFHKN